MTDVKFPVCHLFYYPTQTILVDDDPDFLDAVSLLLRSDSSYRLFQSAKQALTHINSCNQHVDIIRRCYSSYKTGPFDSDTLSHVDIHQIYKEVYNPLRFSTPAVVVVDYSMPEMNGLDFCSALTNPYVKKILLTGQADTDVAVQAFNEGVIDQYISKKDQNLATKLNRSIASLQHYYFNRTFKLITDPVIANKQCGFVSDPGFITHFREVISAQNVAEYYLVDEPYSGFFMLDEKGNPSLLLVLEEARLSQHLQHCRSAGAPAELLDQLAAGELLPLFNVASEEGVLNEEMLTQWQKYYAASSRVAGSSYLCALLGEDRVSCLLRSYRPGDVASYHDHGNDPLSPSPKFLH